MKRWLLPVLGFLLSYGHALALDRQAFTITSYRLDAQVDRASHVIAVTGRLVLRNDSQAPQKNVSLQISSQLEWNAIGTDAKPADCGCLMSPAEQPLQWLGQTYTSDIDHTGSLSEAIVTLDKQAEPGVSIVLDVQYGGRITPDATRLTRMGTPHALAARNDWDQISDAFTVVRGAGYVVWYPVAMNGVSMSDGNAVEDAIARWSERHRATEFFAYLGLPMQNANDTPCIVSNASVGSGYFRVGEGIGDRKAGEVYPQDRGITLQAHGLAKLAPAFAMYSTCGTLSRPSVEVTFTPAHALIAKDYVIGAESTDPLLKEWLSETDQPIRIFELTDAAATPYQDGSALFVPLLSSTQQNLQLLLLPTQVSARAPSNRPWIKKGLGLFLQAKSIEQREARAGALRFLGQYGEPLARAEKMQAGEAPGQTSHGRESDNTLLNTNDELDLRVKAGFVFWMLSDMLGDAPLQRALLAYKLSADEDPTQLQKLLETETKQKLEWFFDDWVYRDRGLPDFKVESAVTRKLLTGAANDVLVTATVANLGDAGAEVPVIVRTSTGQKSARVLLKAHDKAVVRIEVPDRPTQVVVNDGSVPESDTSNNIYQIETKPQP